ncbi:hypothetical protein BDQ17DRAFT_790364 [Cyathus striatus]|nr:hypothetical protein BDQ17DRAFT_790364 [Cyathus striatus]
MDMKERRELCNHKSTSKAPPPTRAMFFSAYWPHAVYAAAITSLSIHLVTTRRAISDDHARVEARTSILNSITEQLRSDTPLSKEELERLKKLAQLPKEGDIDPTKTVELKWTDVIFRRKPNLKDGELSDWDKKDIANFQREAEK